MSLSHLQTANTGCNIQGEYECECSIEKDVEEVCLCCVS